MRMRNAEIAQMLKKIGALEEIRGANAFRVRAYGNAARTLDQLATPVADMVEAGEDLTELDAIGESIAAKIEEAVRTGGMEQLDELEKAVPPGLIDLLQIQGLGPKRVQALQESLEIENLGDLQRAAEAGKVAEVEGLGPKTEQMILEEIPRVRQESGRTRWDVADSMAQPLIQHLRSIDSVDMAQVAGSYRRCKETVGDLDILVISSQPEQAIRGFVEYDQVDQVLSQGETKATVLLNGGLQADLRVVEQKSTGAALFYFTGSKDHNIKIRQIAVDAGLKVNEYGVFLDEERIAGETEESVYAVFDMPVIPPALREDRGEIQAAQASDLPDLVTVDDIRGDLQSHTRASDGRASLREMADAAADQGHAYLAITDHSAFVSVTQGLDEDDLAAQMEEIDRLNDELDGIVILKGVEVDIDQDGTLTLPDEVLAKLDLVIGSVHSAFDLTAEQQTDRILQAMDNPHMNILAHPTGRRLGSRGAMDLDMERLMEGAKQRGCILEINAQPERLDLNDIYAKLAQEIGVKIAISTDAHATGELGFMRFGVAQARRGWLEAGDVINTKPLPDLKQLLKRE